MSAVSIFYYLRVAILMFERPTSDQPAYDWPRTTVAGGIVLALCAAGTLVLGVFVALLLNVVTMVQAGMLPRI
jgi:NADH:ubiquinone oxidoreductase subunit 2 (subunit N)